MTSAQMPIWAATGTKVAPDATKISVGWLLGEKPPHEYMNWWMDQFTQRVNHTLLNGVPEWISTTTYPVGALAKRGGVLYRALFASTNSVPPSANWLQVTQNAAALTAGILPAARLVGDYSFANLTLTGKISAPLSQINTLHAASGTALAPSFAFVSDNGSGMFRPGTNLLGLAVASVERLRLTTAGASITGTLSWSGVATGNGSGITAINATNIATGTIADARLPTTMAGKSFTTGIDFGSRTGAAPSDVSQHLDLYGGTYGLGITGSRLNIVCHSTATIRFMIGTNESDGYVNATGFVGNGSLLTLLNASQLTSGTVPAARMSGNYAWTDLTLSGDLTVPLGNISRVLTATGSATSPAVSFISDPTMGMWRNSTSLEFSTQGNTRLLVSPTAVTAVNGAVFTGPASGLTGVPAPQLTGVVPIASLPVTTQARDWVGERMGDVPAGSVGSTAFLERVTVGVTSNPGSIVAGSSLRYGSAGEAGEGSAPLGSWMCTGFISSSAGGGAPESRTTSFRRIS